MAFPPSKASSFLHFHAINIRPLILSISILLALITILEALEVGGKEIGGNGIFKEILRDEAVLRLQQLGKVSDREGYLERTFLSPASLRAADLIISWMHDAGLKTWVDQMGNIHGRTESITASPMALLIGSHMDTVVDAGMYDGTLGIICAISAVKALKMSGKLEKLQRPIEVIAFSDEEGIRFQSTFLGSAAIAGILPTSILQVSDKSGFTLQDVLKENSVEATDEILSQVRYNSESVWGYIEVHIEQGPVLETLNYPLGVVKGIAGQTRLKVTVSGTQGHAGTVPMLLRQDPMVASADLIVTLESLCKNPDKYLTHLHKESFAGLVCTVGELFCWPSASNVIPGQVNFTVDIRAMDDKAKEAIVSEFSKQISEKCDGRLVNCAVEQKHSAEATHCDKELSSELKHAADSSIRELSSDVLGDMPVLMSGAGHDAMAMAKLTKIGMLFVRCRGGISHSPDEFVMEDDVWAAGLALVRFLEQHVDKE
ncbi:putative allantoate deiminase isoform X3 [Carex littledalei]|uniref:allantoate deiminase n=1 Tax=Carex littledalei TaxID=544730 RepID=A0A833QTR5_9POAL|nr:putative allantoate deiminase isoform X3 [Carex littledalei]